MINTRLLRKTWPLAVAGAFMLTSTSASAQQCQSLVWSDEFEGSSLDLNNWEPMIGDGCSYGICGWGNNELQYYTAENATVSHGTLKITAKKERVKASGYTSARLRTANMPNSGEWTHGRFEARIKLPVGAGLWPAFWMLPTDPDVGWPMSGEIDIMESKGQASMLASGTIHYGDPWPDNRWSGGHILSQPGKWSDNFHTYAVEWSPYEIRWYLDDILYSTKTPDDMEDSTWWTFENYRYHFLLNVAVGGSLGGPVDDSIFPVTMETDWVRVYDMGQPSVDGPNIVKPNEVASYSVVDENGSNSSYSWSVPAGATLTGSGSSVQVDFSGASAGNVSVTVTNSCGTRELVVPVFVEPTLSMETMLDNFGDTRTLNYTYHDGTFNVANGVLTYTRNPEAQWDVIAADTNAITDAGPLVAGHKAFVMDINNTDPALVGKVISIQLEDSSVATSDNFPSGRHSRYDAKIEHANGWQTLRFRLGDRLDGLMADTAVNSMVMLIDPNAFTSDTYVIDNIGILGDGGSEPPPEEEASATVVTSVTTGTQSASKGQKYGTATVTVTDDLGSPVAGATVTGTFSGTWNESGSAVTNADGVASFVTSTAAKGKVAVNFCVDDVTGTTYPLDPAASTGMCQ
jgi:beta-glucanase (GH16 family)